MTTFFRPKRPPRALQEALKSSSAATAQLSGIPKQLCIDLDVQKTTSGLQKSLKSIKKTILFEEIVFSARVVFSTPFWTLLASILGAFCHPRWQKPIPLAVSRWPWRVHRYSFWPPKPSREPPGAFQDASNRSPATQDAPR